MSIHYATGRRKEAIARVWLEDGQKGLQINDRSFENYFPREADRIRIQEPLKVANFTDRFGVRAIVKGGGPTGQAAAVRLGIGRALVKFDENLRPALRKGGPKSGRSMDTRGPAEASNTPSGDTVSSGSLSSLQRDRLCGLF